MPLLPARRLLPVSLLTVLALLVPATPTPAAAAVIPPAITPFGDWAPAACPQPSGAGATTTTRLTIHHTHEPVARTPEEVRPALAATCAVHVARGFSTIGYHYVVDPWGGVHQGRGALPDAEGRAPAAQPEGAHVAGSNPGAVGIVFLGDHEEEPPTAAALDAAIRLAAWLLDGTGIDPHAMVVADSTGGGTARFSGRFEVGAVDGHGASNNTACPGAHLTAVLPAVRDGIARALAGELPAAHPPLEEPAAPAAPVGPTATPAPPGGPAATSAAPGGPIATPVERLARSLNTVGLVSLATRMLGDLLG